MGQLLEPWIVQDDAAAVLADVPTPLRQTPKSEPTKASWLDYAEAQGRKELKKELRAERKEAREKLKEELKRERKEARKKLADELRTSRQKLRALEWKIRSAGEVAEKAVEEKAREKRKEWAARLSSAKARLKALRADYTQESLAWMARTKPVVDEMMLGRLYPDVPPPAVTPTKEGASLPTAPGVYFFWAGDVVEYVGQSVRLADRVKLGTHHILREDHRVSFLFFEARELTWAECYYIGALRPYLNFGKRARHYEPGTDEVDLRAQGRTT